MPITSPMDSVPETCGPGIWTRERLLSWHGSTELRRVPLWTVALEVGHQTANGARFALESRAFRSCQPPRRLRLLRSRRLPYGNQTGIKPGSPPVTEIRIVGMEPGQNRDRLQFGWLTAALTGSRQSHCTGSSFRSVGETP